MAPTDEQLKAANTLRHFLVTVDDLHEMQEAMPLGGFDSESAEERGQARWRTVLWAMLLRKYFQPNDKLYIGSVMDAVIVRSEARSEPDPRYREGLEDLKAAATNVDEINLHTFEGPASSATGVAARLHEGDILRLALYGKYMHGDPAKWERLSDMRRYEMIALRSTIEARVFRVDGVARLALRYLVDEDLVEG